MTPIHQSLFPESTPDLNQLIADGAIFYISHSGGKDSQAMYAMLAKVIPADQIMVVHADLGEVEWEGVKDHIRDNIFHDLNVVQAPKTFFEMVRNRAKTRPDVPSFPSSAQRQCTSDLKRNPIATFIRRDLTARGCLLGINCMGLRAEESSARAKRQEWTVNKSLSKASREVWDWNPIHQLTTERVFEIIAEAGQEAFWAYAAGNTRLSCVFCIMGCQSDLANGRKHRPELFAQYVELEEETGWTMFAEQSLAEAAKRATPTQS